jgi:hypothetical protein
VADDDLADLPARFCRVISLNYVPAVLHSAISNRQYGVLEAAQKMPNSSPDSLIARRTRRMV